MAITIIGSIESPEDLKTEIETNTLHSGKVPISAIIVGDRKRDLGDIKSLAESIRELGLLNPITILPDGTLVAGLHRLEAVKYIGWTEIDVRVVQLDELHAELAEIDENLRRNELHWLDRDKQLKRRKEIYEALHPETKPGGDKRSKLPQLTQPKADNWPLVPSFVQDTANKTNAGVSTIKDSIQRATAFTDEQGEILKRSAVPQTDATKLARKEEPERNAIIAKLAEASKPIKVKDAITAVKREEMAEKAKSVTLPDTIQILDGDFISIGETIDNDSVDFVFTDPPYHEEHLGLWENLGKFAYRVLKPGGVLLAYSGKSFLPQVLDALRGHLEYCWILGQFHKGQHTRIWKYRIWTQWRPLVLFSKGKMIEHEWFIDMFDEEKSFTDIIVGSKGDKEAHEWAQGENEAQYFIQKFTKPGDLVVDPMCGSGTIVRMAHRFKRHAIGIEKDIQRHKIALGTMEGIMGEVEAHE